MVGETLPHLTLLFRGEYASSSQSPTGAKRTSSKKSFSKCGDTAHFDLKLRSGESVDPDNRPGREGTRKSARFFFRSRWLLPTRQRSAWVRRSSRKISAVR